MIQLIAVDMDGTFLDEKSDYNRQRFQAIYQELTKRGIRFVIASGNQYEQIISFFSEMKDDIAYVSENGGLVTVGDQQIYHAEMSSKAYRFILDWCRAKGDLEMIVNGLHAAYIQQDFSDAIKEYAAIFAYNLKEVERLEDIRDVMIKAYVKIPQEKLMAYIADFNAKAPDELIAVKSGDVDMDMMIKGVSKATGLRQLLAYYDLSMDQVMTFGNSHNDLEMLQEAKYGFAMANADAEVLETAAYRAPSNRSEGVLEVIEHYLETGDLTTFRQ